MRAVPPRGGGADANWLKQAIIGVSCSGCTGMCARAGAGGRRAPQLATWRIMRLLTALLTLIVAMSTVSLAAAKGSRKRTKKVLGIDWHTTRKTSAQDKAITTLTDLMNRANAALDRQNIDLAVSMYSQALRVYPDFEFANYNLAEVLYRAGKDPARSQQHFERAWEQLLDNDPKRFLKGPQRLTALRVCSERLGKIYHHQGKLTQESALYAKAVTHGVFRDPFQRPQNIVHEDLPLEPWPKYTEWPVLAQVKKLLQEAHTQIKQELLHAENGHQFFINARSELLDSSSSEEPSSWQTWNYMHNGKTHRDRPGWRAKVNPPAKLTGGTDIVLWSFGEPGVRWNEFVERGVKCSDGTYVDDKVTADENNQVPPNKKGKDRLLLVDRGRRIILEKTNMTANTNYTFTAEEDLLLEADSGKGKGVGPGGLDIIRLPDNLLKPVIHVSAADFNRPKTKHMQTVAQRLEGSEQFEKTFAKTKAVIDRVVALAAKDLPHANIEFVLLKPGTRTQPLCGSSNHKMHVQLGVLVPSSSKTVIRVGDSTKAQSTRQLQEGEVLIFDEVRHSNAKS